MNVQRLREDLAVLKLGILELEDLTDRQIDILANACRDPKTNSSFRELFPIPVAARFKQAAYNEIYEWAEKATELYSFYPNELDEHPFVREKIDLYADDVMKLCGAIVGNKENCHELFKTCDIGKQEKPKAAALHRHMYDGKMNPFEMVAISCVSRIGNLGFESISNAEVEHLTPKVRKLINRGMAEGGHALKARQRLRALKKLVPSPLGAVTMLLEGRPHGVLHCSCEKEMPQGGIASGFFYAAIAIPINSPRL